jgi:hypothetical protein
VSLYHWKTGPLEKIVICPEVLPEFPIVAVEDNRLAIERVAVPSDVVALVTLFGPAAPVAPVAPVLPRGIVKLNTAADVVPLLVTLALVPAAPVVVVPTAIVAAVPAVPCGPTFKRMIVGLPALPSSTKSGPEKARISTVEMLMV